MHNNDNNMGINLMKNYEVTRGGHWLIDDDLIVKKSVVNPINSFQVFGL